MPVLAYDVSEFVPGSAKGRNSLHSVSPFLNARIQIDVSQ